MKTLKEKIRYCLVIDFGITKNPSAITEAILVVINNHKIEEAEEAKRRSDEFDADRYDEPPGTWKQVKGFTNSSGWTS